MCSVALTGVLALQAGRQWVERGDDGDDGDETLVQPVGNGGKERGGDTH